MPEVSSGEGRFPPGERSLANRVTACPATIIRLVRFFLRGGGRDDDLPGETSRTPASPRSLGGGPGRRSSRRSKPSSLVDTSPSLPRGHHEELGSFGGRRR